MGENGLYILLPAISAIACAYLLTKLYLRCAGFEFISLFVSLVLINFTQVVAYSSLPYSFALTSFFADLYLIALYFFFTQLALFAVSLSGQSVSTPFRTLVYAFPVTLILFHFAGLMVESYRLENGAVLHNDGELAWLFDLLILVTSFATISTLWRNAKNNFENKVIASKNIIALITFIPIVFAIATLVLLSRTDYAVPVVIVVPLITLYTALAFYYLIRERVVAVSVGVGFFVNRLKLANRLLELKNSKDEIRTFTKEVEKQFIVEAMELHGGDIQATADHLGMNHTTLRNKLKEYEVNGDKDRVQVKAV